MIRRRTTIPLFAWLSRFTREGSTVDSWRERCLKRSIYRLNDGQLDLFVTAHQPRGTT